jgi:hypothetical protein
MNSHGLQELVKKVFGDEATRAEFVKDPAGVAAKFNLSEDEKRAVLTTHSKFGLISSNSGQLEAAIKPAAGEWWAPAP